MSSQVQEREWSDFSVVEWHRLNRLANKFDTQMKTAYLRTVIYDDPKKDEHIREVVTSAVVETAIGTARNYGLGFDPERPIYRNLVNSLTNNYMKVVKNEDAKDKVRKILPPNLSLADRSNRLNVLGLSGRDAVRLERMRQNGSSREHLSAARFDMSVQRGNIVALTEINRIINSTLESVWLDNLTISKAKSYQGQWYQESNGQVATITSLRGIPIRAKKSIITRRDNRVCHYCLPLEGKTARLNTDFKTDYGSFPYPPFHPRCRCFMIVSF